MPKKLFVFAVVITSFLIFNDFPTQAGSVDVDLLGEVATAPQDIFVKGNSAYVAAGSMLSIVNIYYPANPRQTSHCDMPGWTNGTCVSGKNSGWARGVYVSGNYAYVAAGNSGLRIINISHLSSPFEIGHCATPDYAYGIYVSGDYAYIADDDHGLRIIDVSDPSNPTEVGYYPSDCSTFGVYVSGDYAYIADSDSGLGIIDISNPSNPTKTGYYRTPGPAYGVYVSGDYAYVADGSAGLRVIDISNPSSPTEVGFCDTPGFAQGVAVSGSHAYVADGDHGLRVIDISDPFNPTEAGHYDTSYGAIGVCVSGSRAYVAEYLTYAPKSPSASFSVLDYAPPRYIRGYVKEFKGTEISGLPVTLTSTDGTKVTSTDENGYYEFTNFPPGNYTVTAAKPGYRFASYTISPTQSKVSRSLTAYPTIYSIKGCVRDAAGNEVNGVTVNLSGKSAIESSTSTSTVTLNGHYELKNLIIGNYKITPSKPGWSFTPSSKSYTWLNSALDNQDFMAIPMGVEQGEVKIVGGEKGYVNPGNNEAARVFFKPEPFGSTVNIKIYTLRGQLVWEKTMEVSGGNQEVIEWACKNAEGEAVASGIYLIYVKGAGIDVRKKIAIVR